MHRRSRAARRSAASGRPDDRIWVENSRLLEDPASRKAQLGDSLLDGFECWLLVVPVGDDQVLLAVDFAAETEDQELAICGGVPSHSPVPGPGVVRVDEAAIGARVDVWLTLQLGVFGWVDVRDMSRPHCWIAIHLPSGALAGVLPAIFGFFLGLCAVRLSLIVASFGMLDGLSGSRSSVDSFCSGEPERSEAASSLSLLWELMVLSFVLVEGWGEM